MWHVEVTEMAACGWVKESRRQAQEDRQCWGRCLGGGPERRAVDTTGLWEPLCLKSLVGFSVLCLQPLASSASIGLGGCAASSLIPRHSCGFSHTILTPAECGGHGSRLASVYTPQPFLSPLLGHVVYVGQSPSPH